MDCIYRQYLKAWTLALVCLLSINEAHAVAYTFPGNAVAPLVLDSNTNDTLTVLSGTFETTNSTIYTVDFSSDDAIGATVAVTVDSGATLSYDGTNSLGRPLNAIHDIAGQDNIYTITNNGTISSGTGLFSIYITTTDILNNTYTITNNGAIVGNVYIDFVGNSNTTNFNLNGSATISGGVVMSSSSLNSMTLNIGPTTACNFTTTGTYDGMRIIISNGSTFTQNFSATNIDGITINTGGTYNLNASLTGETTTTNNGTFNIAANITKTGLFNTGVSGNTVITQEVDVSTTSYNNAGTHTAQLFDLNNIGNMTQTNGASTPINFNIFTVTYTGGYLTTDTYTLFTASAGIDTAPSTYNLPSNTIFLTFATPTASATAITMGITRTPFNTYASTPYAQNIAGALEAAGNNSPSEAMLDVLNGVEECTTAACVQAAMLQLGPLTTAPLYTFMLENVVLRPAELRLAALRNKDVYMAGDIGKYDDFIMGTQLRENYVWMRPYGAYANQGAVDDIVGYYATSGGIAFGLDRNLDAHYSVGLGLSYTYSQVNDKINIQSTTNVKSYQGMIYGSYNFTDTRYTDWILSITGNQYNGQRYMAINSFVATANSKYTSQNFTVKAITGQNYAAFDFLQITPEASIMYTFTKQYSYLENNGGGANLSISRNDASTVQLGIGGKLAIPLAVMPSVVMPEIHAMYLYNVVNGDQNSAFYFLEGATNTVTSYFTPPRSAIRYGAALTIAVFDSLQVKAAIDAQRQDRYSSYWVYLNLKYLL